MFRPRRPGKPNINGPSREQINKALGISGNGPIWVAGLVVNVPQPSSGTPTTPTPTPSVTATNTPTPSVTATNTSTPTNTPTTTQTPTASITSTPTNTQTTTPTTTPTNTPTPTDPRDCRTYIIQSNSFGSTQFDWTNCDGSSSATTLSFGASTTICAKNGSVSQSGFIGTITDIGTCPLPTPTSTPTSTQTPTNTTTATNTPTTTPTNTSTPTPTNTQTPTNTETPTNTPTPTQTPTPSSLETCYILTEEGDAIQTENSDNLENQTCGQSTIDYITNTNNFTVSGTPGETIASFTGVSIGGDGLIVLSVHCFGANDFTIDQVTLNGFLMNKIAISGPSTSGIAHSIAYLRNTNTASTANITVKTLGGGGSGYRIGVYRIQNNISDTPIRTNTSTSFTTSSNVNLTGLSDNSLIVAGITQNNGNSVPITWTGVTEDYDINNNNPTSSSGHTKKITSGDQSINASTTIAYSSAVVSVAWT